MVPRARRDGGRSIDSSHRSAVPRGFAWPSLSIGDLFVEVVVLARVKREGEQPPPLGRHGVPTLYNLRDAIGTRGHVSL